MDVSKPPAAPAPADLISPSGLCGSHTHVHTDTHTQSMTKYILLFHTEKEKNTTMNQKDQKKKKKQPEGKVTERKGRPSDRPCTKGPHQQRHQEESKSLCPHSLVPPPSPLLSDHWHSHTHSTFLHCLAPQETSAYGVPVSWTATQCALIPLQRESSEKWFRSLLTRKRRNARKEGLGCRLDWRRKGRTQLLGAPSFARLL